MQERIAGESAGGWKPRQPEVGMEPSGGREMEATRTACGECARCEEIGSTRV